MSDQQENSSTPQKSQPESGGKKPYVAPRIISVERLEAAASNCEIGGGGPGKTVPSPCGALSS